ncbi:MAG TPA: ChbG/HpnK family deacetylase [Gemmataceae bacterium]|nr:ChbG/HpnK family deacetylase [Gemmataceae bacterium]
MSAGTKRQLMVIADDYGIGPATSAGILELAQIGVVTGSVLLVNSPYTQAEVGNWHRAGRPMELGWHPNLTLDAPIAPPHRVPSLVNAQGRFWPLATFMKRLFFGRLRVEDIATELKAQLHLYIELVGHAPRLVNSHQHISIFTPVGQIMLELLRHHQPRAYVRRVREPWSLIWRIQGARKKRAFLSFNGRSTSRLQQALGFPGNDWLGGITDPPWVKRPDFFESWLGCIPGVNVEMSCHPGHADATLLGRDCETADGMMQRRVDELQLLRRPEFFQAVARAGFQMISPSQLMESGVTRAA